MATGALMYGCAYLEYLPTYLLPIQAQLCMSQEIRCSMFSSLLAALDLLDLKLTIMGPGAIISADVRAFPQEILLHSQIGGFTQRVR